MPGYINTDFADVYNTLKNGNVAIMNVGRASGEERITNAIRDALNSPLVNTGDVRGAKRVLLQLYCSTEHAVIMQELEQIHRFVEQVGPNVEVQWGASIDESLGEDVRITIIATGYEVSDIPSLTDVVGKASLDDSIRAYYEKKEPEPQPVNEDEKTVEIDLTRTLDGTKTESQRERPAENTDGEIVIEDDELAQEEPKPEKPHKPWLFRRIK